MTSDSKKPPKSKRGAGERSTPQGRPAISREAYPTLTDPAELEAARRRSLELLAGESSPPRAAGSPPLVNLPPPSARSLALTTPPAPLLGDELDPLGWTDEDDEQMGEHGPPTLRVEVPTYKDGAPSERIPPAPPKPSMRERSSSRLRAATPIEATPPAPVVARKSLELEALGPEREMRERYSLGDYAGALAAAERVLESEPTHVGASQLAESCRSTLEKSYVARIGALDGVPIVIVPREQLRWLAIDHRAGFVLSHIDGVSSLEMILDVSGMPKLDALRIICELADQRIISMG